ncbi:MAG: MFS transporter [Novosphingobium sp.]
MGEQPMAEAPSPADRERPIEPSLFSPLRHRMFMAVWLTNTLSNFGFQIQSVGAAWAMTLMAGSPKLVGLVVTAQLLPMVLLSLVFGAVADVFDRRRVLLVAQLIRMAAAAALAAIAFAGLLTPALLLLLTFLLGCGLALNSPAAQAVVGDLVPLADVPAAVTLNSMGFNLARTLAPAVGGVVVAAAGAQAAFLVNALCYIALLVVLVRWRRPPAEPTVARESIWSATGGGLRYVVHAHGVGRIVARAALCGCAMAALTALLPLVVKEQLRADSALYGVMLGCAGVGAVSGGFARVWLRARLSGEGVLQLAQAMIVAALLITALSHWAPLTGLAQLLYGAGMFLSLNSFTVTMQLSVPRWVVGRAMAVVSMGNMGGFALGGWLWGTLAESAGVVATQQVAALLLVGAMLLGRRLPLLDPDPELHRPSSRRLPSRFTFAERDGSLPVAVQREFRIAADRHEAFLALMRERRRMRLRQGVRQWTLAQDVSEPELWIERYHLSSWDDLRRSAERMTIEEERNLDEIVRLHVGEERPPVRFLIERDVAQRAPPTVRPEEGF